MIAINKWMDVKKDGQPETDDLYLTYSKDARSQYRLLYWDSTEELWESEEDCGRREASGVTHWMAFPGSNAGGGGKRGNGMRLIDADAAKKKCVELQKESRLDYLAAGNVIAFLDGFCPTVETPSLWISVKDRLPENGGYYLVGSQSNNSRWIDHYSKAGGWSARDEGEATHWMPLPELPEEDLRQELGADGKAL